jgi:hypothetical protein
MAAEGPHARRNVGVTGSGRPSQTFELRAEFRTNRTHLRHAAPIPVDQDRQLALALTNGN